MELSQRSRRPLDDHVPESGSVIVPVKDNVLPAEIAAFQVCVPSKFGCQTRHLSEPERHAQLTRFTRQNRALLTAPIPTLTLASYQTVHQFAPEVAFHPKSSLTSVFWTNLPTRPLAKLYRPAARP
jgi:hypothetical protein